MGEKKNEIMFKIVNLYTMKLVLIFFFDNFSIYDTERPAFAAVGYNDDTFKCMYGLSWNLWKRHVLQKLPPLVYRNSFIF